MKRYKIHQQLKHRRSHRHNSTNYTNNNIPYIYTGIVIEMYELEWIIINLLDALALHFLPHTHADWCESPDEPIKQTNENGQSTKKETLYKEKRICNRRYHQKRCATIPLTSSDDQLSFSLFQEIYCFFLVKKYEANKVN